MFRPDDRSDFDLFADPRELYPALLRAIAGALFVVAMVFAAGFFVARWLS